MSSSNDAVIVLNRALDQMGDVLASIHQGHLTKPTPCNDWDVGHLIAHVLAAPGNFLQMSQGEQPDWSATPPLAEDEWAAEFRNSADDLIHFWHQQGDEADTGKVDWQTAEMAVHTWDLVRATGMRIGLDPQVAERGLAFMSQGLTEDNRGQAFGPAVEVADDAPIYERLVAFAGRDPN